MKIIIKIEQLINKILFFLIQKIKTLLLKITPPIVLKFFSSVKSKIILVWDFFKKIIIKINTNLLKLKSTLDFSKLKSIITQVKEIVKKNKNTSEKKQNKMEKLKVPLLLIEAWLGGLSPIQILGLVTFSMASFIAGLNMFYSGQRLMGSNTSSEGRSPASIEEEKTVSQRPKYHKKTTKDLLISTVKLNVYDSNLGELKSMTIDFTATMSNRFSKKVIEKYEFEFRDHIINQFEPVPPTFPLTDEGKEIVRLTIAREINTFLKKKNVEGEVKELQLTYMLGH